MDNIRSFIVTLVTTLILMTAVELIAPDNSIKKYINFVLGLILISVMLTPIISFFSSGETKIINEISKYEDGITQTVGTKEAEDLKKRESELFKKNLNQKCEKSLQDEFKGKKFKADITCEINLKEMSYSIDKVKVWVNDSGIRKIQKVEIDTSVSSEVVDSKNNEANINDSEEILGYLEKILGVKSENIELYTMND